MTTDRGSPKSSPTQHWLVGGGEMGQLVRSMDWSQTPLGPIESWPASLRTTVSLALNSNFPICIAWGPQHTQIYNDGYWPICGTKHPRSMGENMAVCWASAFPVIGASFESALAGNAAFLENQRMFLDRFGYLEETFFTFSFSPIRDETGQIVGLLNPVTDTTSSMLNQRRTRVLSNLAACGIGTNSVQQGFDCVTQALADANLDIPFALCYRLSNDGRRATLTTATGLQVGMFAAPSEIELGASTDCWNIEGVAASGIAEYRASLPVGLRDLSCDPYPEPILSAYVLPIQPPGTEQPSYVLVAGVSPRLPMTEAYRQFYEFVAGAITTVFTSAIAHVEERRRAEALAEIDRAKTLFFSNISHELRTPLTLILGPLEEELAEADLLPQTHRERLQTVYRNSLRLLKLVNALLDFSRIEAGRMTTHFEPTDLATLTIDLTASFRALCESAGLALHVDCPALPVRVSVDRDMWEKIVLNLLSNAFKYTLKGAITVTLRADPETVTLTVDDTGVGIQPQDITLVFQRFYRAKSSCGRSVEGTGIGLAMIKELVALHNGDIRVESSVGIGTRFIVTIPVIELRESDHPAAADEQDSSPAVARARPFVTEARQWMYNDPSPETTPFPVTAESANRPVFDDPSTLEGDEFDRAADDLEAVDDAQRTRIVYADDSADMRAYVKRLLTPQYEVELVANGKTALAAIHRQRPDLVILDVMMPGLNGFELMAHLRGDHLTRSLPIILISARAGPEARLEGLRAGADDYLAKPFNARELQTRVATTVELAKIRRDSDAALRAIEKTALIKASEARFRATFEQAAVGIAHVSLDGCWLRVNQKLCAILGYTQEELMDLRFQELTVNEDLAADLERVKQILQGEIHQYSIEKRYIRKCGEIFWANLTVSLVRKKNGDPNYFISVVEDIQQRKDNESALNHSRAQLQAVLDNMSEGIIIADLDGQLNYWNRAALDLHGFKSMDDCRAALASFVDTYEFRTLEDRFVPFQEWPLSRILNGEVLRSVQLRVRRMDRSWERIFSYNGSLGYDASGTALLALLTVTDISAQKEAELKLRAGEAMLRVITDAVPALIAYVDSEHRYHFVNRRYEEWFGLTAENVIGKKINEVLGEKAYQNITPYLEQVFTGYPVSYEMDIEYQHLGPLAIHAEYVPDVDADGNTVGFFALVTDISPRRRAEADLRLWADAFNYCAHGIAVGDARTNRLMVCNPAAATLSQRTVAEMQGLPIFEIFPEEERAQIKAHIDEADRLGKVRYESLIRRVDGSPVPVQVDVVSVRNEAGEPVYRVATVQDITSRRMAETGIRLLNAELEARVEARTAELQMVNRELESFSYAVAHDLRAPLRHISGFSQLLERATSGLLDDNALGLLSRITKSSSRMGQMIDELLAFSRMGRTAIKRSKFDLLGMIDAVITELEPEIAHRQIEWQLPGATAIRADAPMIELVLTNLIANAVKFTKKRDLATIRISCTVAEGEVIVSIADNGAGFDMRYADQLFGVFQRLHAADEFPGTGIGLATVRRIVARHGGRTWAEGKLDEGAIFYFSLPTIEVSPIDSEY